MATDHTAGAPPSFGSTIFANIGWIENRSSAETNSVNPYRKGKNRTAAACRSSAGDIRSEAWKSDINTPGTGNSGTVPIRP